MSDVVGPAPSTAAPSEADASPKLGAAADRHPAAVDVELRPLEGPSLARAVRADLLYAKDRAQTHELRAGRWDLIARWTRLIVALSAAVSSISLLADNVAITTAFSIATAVIAALNAAFNPPDSATQHRQSAKEYSAIVRRLDLLWRRLYDRPSWSSVMTKQEEADDKAELKAAYLLFLDYRSQVEVADDRAPAINRIYRSRGKGIDEGSDEGGEQAASWWQLRRLKRALKYKLATQKTYLEFQGAVDRLYHAQDDN